MRERVVRFGKGVSLVGIQTDSESGVGAELPGIEEVASKVLGLPARKASFTPGSIAPELARHENATVLGLLHYGLEDHGLPGRKRKENEEGIFTKLKDLIGIG